MVDGIFPFDVHYYPLFGYLDHYIWFSALLKGIAKLRGSYRCINNLRGNDLL